MTSTKFQINHKFKNSSIKPFEISILVIGTYLFFGICFLKFLKMNVNEF